MQNAVARPVSNLKLLAIYAACLVGGVVLFIALAVAAEIFFQFSFTNPSMGFIVMFVAGNYVGQFWHSRELARPAPARAWGVALLCTAFTLVLQGLFGWVNYKLALQTEFTSFAGDDLMILAAVMGILGVISLLVIRLSISMGVRQAVKQAERLAQKAAKP